MFNTCGACLQAQSFRRRRLGAAFRGSVRLAGAQWAAWQKNSSRHRCVSGQLTVGRKV